MYAVLLLGKQCRINNSESESESIHFFLDIPRLLFPYTGYVPCNDSLAMLLCMETCSCHNSFVFIVCSSGFGGYATVTIVLTFIIICVCLSEYVASMGRGKQCSKPTHAMPSHFAQCNGAMSVVHIRSQYSCLVVLFNEDVLFCSSPSSDLAARRGVFSRRHYGSVETVSCARFLYQIPTSASLLYFHQSHVNVKSRLPNVWHSR